MPRLLMLAYFFPPDGGGGAQRPGKFCRYLPDFGWQSTVITRDTERARTLWDPNDPSMNAEIGPSSRVIRVASSAEPVGWARGVPQIDVARNWLEPAYDAALAALRETPHDAIFATMSPFDVAYLARRLADETQLPIVLDLRDPWALDGWRLHGTRARWKLDHQAMCESLVDADCVIANTPESRTALVATIDGLEADRVAVIPNGYDAADFSGPPPARTSTDAYEIVHSGTFHTYNLYRYEGLLGKIKQWRHHRPEPIDPRGRTPLFVNAALNKLRQDSPETANSFRLVIMGPQDDATVRCVRESGVANQVEFTGYLNHDQAVARVRAADALFLPLHGLPPGYRSLIVPGKTYEYLATGRPILAALPEGDARELAQRSGRGFCADPCDAVAIAQQLRDLHAYLQSESRESTAPLEWTVEYERRSLTEQLGKLLDAR